MTVDSVFLGSADELLVVGCVEHSPWVDYRWSSSRLQVIDHVSVAAYPVLQICMRWLQAGDH